MIEDPSPESQADEISTVAPSVDGTTEQDPHRYPGPGLFESLIWIVVYACLQIAFMLPLIILVSFLYLDLDDPREFDFNTLPANLQLLMVGTPALLTYFVIIPAGCWRLTPHPGRKLQLSLPTPGQALIAISMVLPLTVVADTIFHLVEQPYLKLAENSAFLGMFENTDVHELISSMHEASLAATLFFIAVVPTLGEEFLFRGLIGRGLTARWGTIVGVGITSVLFASVHLYPPHVLAIIPVGVVLHVLYITTGSFWTPVLFHLINNSLAALLIRFSENESLPSPGWSLVAVAYLIFSLFWLFRRQNSSPADQPPN